MCVWVGEREKNLEMGVENVIDKIKFSFLTFFTLSPMTPISHCSSFVFYCFGFGKTSVSVCFCHRGSNQRSIQHRIRARKKNITHRSNITITDLKCSQLILHHHNHHNPHPPPPPLPHHLQPQPLRLHLLSKVQIFKPEKHHRLLPAEEV